MPESAIFILRFLVFASVHSFLALPRIQEKAGKYFRIFGNCYRLLYNILSLMLFIWLMLSWQGTSVLYVVPGVWSLIMYGLQLLLLVFMAASLRQTGTADFLGIGRQREQERPLITAGCYSIVRHPMYLASIVFMLMNPVMTSRWLTLTALAALYMIAGAVIEENRLLRKFGAEYEDYRERVPFIIPRAISCKACK